MFDVQHPRDVRSVAANKTRHRSHISAIAFALPCLLGGLTLLLRLLAGPRTIDDAYITFHYAQNIAIGNGFVFNPGDHVLGTTTPFYTLLLAALYKLSGVPLPLLGLLVAAIASCLSDILVYVLVLRVTTRRVPAILAATTFALAPKVFFFAQSGMETSLITCTMLACCWFYLHRRQSLWGLTAGIALLTRPDAACFVCVLLIYDLWESHAIPWHALTTVFAVCTPWIVWATWYFGQPIPQSILAKSNNLYEVRLQDTLTTVFQDAGSLVLGSGATRIGLLLLVVTGALSWRALGPGTTRLRPILLFAAIFALIYALGGIKHIAVEPWYLVPLTPIYCFAFWVGVDYALARFDYLVHATGLSILGVAVVTAQLNGLVLRTDAQHYVLTPPSLSSPLRESGYQTVCRHLAALLTPRTVVASSEVGTLGYYCQATILDVAGLVTRGVGHYYPVPAAELTPGTGYAVPSQLVDDRAPDFVVTQEIFARNSLLRDPTFNHDYVQILHLYKSSYGNRGLLVFQRRLDRRLALVKNKQGRT